MRHAWPFAALIGFLFFGCASRGSIKIIKALPQQAKPVAAVTNLSAVSKPLTQQQPLEITATADDSLWKIAKRTLGKGARYPEIVALNHLKSERLHKGQKLRLPPGATLNAASGNVRSKAAADATFPKLPNTAYTLGEKLTFAVQYAGVTGGYATLSVTETAERSGRLCWHIQANAKTNAFFDTFYKVRDIIDSYIDVDSQLSWSYEKHTHEGSVAGDASYIYDQRAHKMLEPAKAKEMAIPPGTQDVLSCFYWFRTHDWKVGDEVSIPVTADDWKSYELKVNILKKERVSCLAGDFDAVLVQPHLKSAGVFQQKGEVFIWLTDDARHIPVKIQSKIAIGSINISLQDAQWVEPQ